MIHTSSVRNDRIRSTVIWPQVLIAFNLSVATWEKSCPRKGDALWGSLALRIPGCGPTAAVMLAFDALFSAQSNPNRS